MILVVDNDPGILKLLRSALEGGGLKVVTAADGVEAYKLVRSPDCKCMVLDVMMPRLNGIELLLLMQADNIHVPTIVMAGFEDFTADEMKQFGNVVRFLRKPFDLQILLDEVRKQLGKAAAAR